MKKLLHSTILILIIARFSYAQALIEIPITYGDGVVGSQVLTVGLDPTGTDGLDASLGEVPAPPLPPFGAFDARFTLPSSSNQTYKDIRQGDNTAASIGDRIHTINYQLGAGSAGLQISWNLPLGVELNLKDPFGGVLFNENFPTGPGNYTVTNIALTSVIMTVKYVDPPFPVELTSFNGSVINEIVRLNWETATEINNFGFEIERKSETTEWTKIGFVQGNGNSNSPKTYNYSDNDPISGSKFLYRLKQIDNDGQFEYSDAVEVILMPMEYLLSQNYPNPFNPMTKIKFAIAEAGRVSLKIFNINGQEVFDLINNFYEAGFYDVELNLSDLSSGTYIYRMQSNNFADSKKLMLIK